MTESLVGRLPKIAAEGKREAKGILKRLDGAKHPLLRTDEFIIPLKGGGLFQSSLRSPEPSEWSNRLISADNLPVLEALLAGGGDSPSMRGKIDLIYIDPPFDSKADYRAAIRLPDGASGNGRPVALEQDAYSDLWENGTESYLRMLYPRLVLMRELLSEEGSFYVHVDWHAGHYVKVLLDDIFGSENFRNEIVWVRDAVGKGAKKTSGQWSREIESILLYSKTKRSFFQQQYRAPEELTHTQLKEFRYSESNGRRFKIVTLGDYSEESIRAMRKKGLIYRTSSGREYKKYYLDEFQLAIGSLWNDISNISHGRNPESVHYATQKPEALLTRIIRASSREGGIVADFFAGSGTTGAVAERLGRRWILCDAGKPACMIMRKRLADLGAKPYLYQSVTGFRRQQSLFRSAGKHPASLNTAVLKLCGASPFPGANRQVGSFGVRKGERTLIFVDSPNGETTLSRVARARRLRDTLPDRLEKLLFLGWNFSPEIGQTLLELQKNDPYFEVRMILPTLLEKRLGKTEPNDPSKKSESFLAGLPCISVQPASVDSYNDEMVRVTVTLGRYFLLSPDALPLAEKYKPAIKKILAEDSLSLIEYWSIDPDYDGKTFVSLWQDYRENGTSGGEAWKIVPQAVLTVPKVSGKRTVCVKAVDIFGFESMAVQEIS